MSHAGRRMQLETASHPHTHGGGDDLDDDLELDHDLIASDDDEQSLDVDEEDAIELGIDEDADGEGATAEGFLTDEEEVTVEKGKKRKVEEEAEGQGETGGKEEKKKRKKEKERARKAKRLAAEKDEVSAAPTHLSPSELASVLLKSLRETFPAASAMEIEDVAVSEDAILPPPDYSPSDPFPQSEGETSDDDGLTGLRARVDSLLKSMKGKKIPSATPSIIVLSLSGLRCADVVRGVRDVKGPGEVAKLFAKHLKFADQVKYLAKTRVSVAVGTPARVGKLLAEGAIKVIKDSVVLLDIGHRDSKNRSLLNLPEVRDELWKSVFSGKAREVLLNGGARIGAF